jgi:hypothetical protein
MAIKRLVVPTTGSPAPTPVSQPVQQPAPHNVIRRKLTDEQAGICGSRADVIKVSAFAGTGKTTTLCAFAEMNPRDRILYVAFNKAIQLEATAKFPGNVVCKTAHSIAYGACGRDYANKLAADIRPFHIQRHLERALRDIPGPAHNLYGARVIETVKNYLVSGDMELGKEHVSIGDAPVERKHFDERTILADASRIWDEMQNTSSDVPMLHDGYLKLFQVKNRKLPYDIILFDEAQDTNPVTQAIVEVQSARKVYVGDRHQAIYGFRGATNAMELIDADEHHYLTGSFRFGQAVADVANTILMVKNEDVRLQGFGQGSRIRQIANAEGYAYITRGNCAIFNRAVQCVTNYEPFSFVGDIKGYRFDQILDVYNLSIGQQVKDAFIRSFAGAAELNEYAKAVNDREILSRCKLVEMYGHDIPRLIERIEQSALPPIVPGATASVSEDDKRIILTTAHKSKGLEFKNVKLAGDFMPLIDDEGKVFDVSKASPSDIEDVNIQYVAATRAMKALHLCESLEEYLDYVSEYRQAAGQRP